MTIFSAAILLFMVMDPFGNIPFFISALKHVDGHRRQKVIIRELLIALLVMVVFLFFGQHFLNVLEISRPALTATGGTILFLIAIKMIFPSSKNSMAEDVSGEPFIVPLAIPYVAGPSTLAALLLIMNRQPARWPEWLTALMVAWGLSGLIIATSLPLSRILGSKLLIAIERLMGMILVAISIQMLMTGISEFILEIEI
jgi:multiple antibiotic resistance protein